MCYNLGFPVVWEPYKGAFSDLDFSNFVLSKFTYEFLKGIDIKENTRVNNIRLHSEIIIIS